VGGETVTYAGLPQMRAVLNDLERQIAECEGIAAKKPRWSSVSMTRGVE
jgi:hypothetical protein